MLLAVLSLVFGFTFLHYASSLLINHAKNIGTQLGVPDWIIGSVILAFGTSLPEVFITISAAMSNNSIMAFGNIIGSNTANIGLAFSLAWVLFGIKNIKINKLSILEMFAISLLVLIIAVFFKFNLYAGILLIILFLLHLFYKIKKHKNNKTNKKTFNVKDYLYCLLAIILLPIASHFVINGAEKLMILLNLSERLVSIIILAIGTSLPEVYTSCLALYKKHSEMAIANIVGSNFFNLSLVLGILSLFGEFNIPEQFKNIDLNMMLIMTVIFSLILLFKIKNRFLGGLIVAAYLGYLASF